MLKLCRGGEELGLLERLGEGRAWCSVPLAGMPPLESSIGARLSLLHSIPSACFFFLLTICYWWYHGLPRCPRQKAGHRPQILPLYLSLSTFNQHHSIQSSLKSILLKTPQTHSFCLLCSTWSKFIFLLGYRNTPYLSVGLQTQNSLPPWYNSHSSFQVLFLTCKPKQVISAATFLQCQDKSSNLLQSLASGFSLSQDCVPMCAQAIR